ncbi:MAG TPA: dihydrofolate reductase family protein [Candidatus Corynebacterium avicola]|uniref:Dihydrofolate reductase family protein n=1 Tax=Candidatus Corynebacterium avicola TaxID=2838527 RepID=A0A9D1RN90_9CORY|nr:dihydrofolate reductase family protein [Candidatus Corynebacterium avicola]
MRELVYYIAVSLDGFIAGPDGQFDAFPMGDDDELFRWIAGRYPDAIPTDMAGGLEPMGTTQADGPFSTVLMGWNTYRVDGEDSMPSPYRHLEQIVFSRSRSATEENLRTTSEDPVAVVRDLKEQDGGDIWLCGGGDLAGALVGEIDRLVLKRNPLMFGDGIPLFGRHGYAPRSFRQIGVHPVETGVIVEEYVRE